LCLTKVDVTKRKNLMPEQHQGKQRGISSDRNLLLAFLRMKERINDFRRNFIRICDMVLIDITEITTQVKRNLCPHSGRLVVFHITVYLLLM